jgi:hypothetical protein
MKAANPPDFTRSAAAPRQYNLKTAIDRTTGTRRAQNAPPPFKLI